MIQGQRKYPISRPGYAGRPGDGVRAPGGRSLPRPKREARWNPLSFLTPKKRSGLGFVIYRQGVDRLFLIVVILLMCIGTVMVFSSSYASALYYQGDSYYYVKKQLIMVVIGLAGMAAAAFLATNKLLRKITIPLFLGVLALNYLTPIIGKVSHGANRWINLGFTQFQPSELLKTAVVLFFAYYIVQAGARMKTFKFGILIPMLCIAAVAGSTIYQHHISGTLIIGVIGLVMIFIGEAPIFWLGMGGAAGAAALSYVIFFTPYATARIQTWLNPFSDPSDAGFQIIQSLYAIGSGGLFGVGIGNSRQKFLYLPEPQNDFIFAIVCEELGFIGAVIIIFLFVILIWRGFVIAFNAPDKFSSLVVMGITIKVAVQTILNIAVVTNAIPNTGISLPFFSYGGTALIILLAEMGIVLCISRYSYHEK